MTEIKLLVLLVEDESQMRTFVRLALAAHGYRVIEVATGREALQQAAAHTPDLVLLDLGLPDIDGLEVTQRLREWSLAPIIILSARGQEDQKVQALDAGADDYLTKPFGSEELMARIRVALRHAARSPQDPASSVATIGALRVDFAKRLVFVEDREVHLTPIEYKLMVALTQHAGMVLTHKQLLDQVWGPGHAHQMQYLRVYMAQLRQKLEETPAHPKYLVTEPGVGYRLKSQDIQAPRGSA
jgi:two-component system KDP operon response regulator KdpE